MKSEAAISTRPNVWKRAPFRRINVSHLHYSPSIVTDICVIWKVDNSNPDAVIIFDRYTWSNFLQINRSNVESRTTSDCSLLASELRLLFADPFIATCRDQLLCGVMFLRYFLFLSALHPRSSTLLLSVYQYPTKNLLFFAILHWLHRRCSYVTVWRVV